MDITSLLGTSSLVTTDRVGLKSVKDGNANLFQTMLNGAIDNINNTNSLLSDAENAEISFAMGETESTHDLIIALQKASTALQYTIAVRDKFMEAYKEIMNMQI
ncbi:MAG: flagellar hook-basal body complex protein FliE [Lachnospiraceae bacterium]|nr:flagellar hook-basal body complex protein FliE [Lachnospiraceae bacterium]